MAGRTRASSSSPTGHGSLRGKNDEDFKYESLFGTSPQGEVEKEEANSKATDALSNRLLTFRDWLSEEAGITVHPSICIVNGEATDGTKNAPVLAFGPPPGIQSTLKKSGDGGRAGLVDSEVDRALYDRTMGCCIRTTKEIKKDEVLLTVPRHAMITPDLVASSDAGRAVLACIKAPSTASETSQTNFWDAFENTSICEARFTKKIARVQGAQMLIRIVQERKRADNAYTKALQKLDEAMDDSTKNGEHNFKLAMKGAISTRAAFLAFLIHQRFSDNPTPPVASDDSTTLEEFRKAKEDAATNSLKFAQDTAKPPGSPTSFAPYARTLPSSISLPLSWQREELVLLSGCISGSGILQEVASRTILLASEFIALLEAGILHRFPTTFPRGLITWERWVWAAACFQSRNLPASCYLNKGETKASEHVPLNRLEFQSPADIWDELGVMIPLMDMLNHEAEAHQVTWQPCVPSKVKSDDSGNGMEVDSDDDSHPPQAIADKRIKKGNQVYCSYGPYSNHNLLLQYGFAQLGNLNDDVRIGWNLTDAVGYVKRPSSYEPPFEETGHALVYDTTDAEATKRWWTEDRMELLRKEVFNVSGDTTFATLKNGKKLSCNASCDGMFDPFLLSSVVIAVLPVEDVTRNLQRSSGGKIKLTKSRQQILRNYLTYYFTKKMEKLLQNVYNGIKDHFKPLDLWTKATQGGLRYNAEEMDSEESHRTGWQSFFEANAYNATLEAENRYYAMGAESCALTLFDGHLRSLQASLDALSTEDNFKETVLRQLEDLDFEISDEVGDDIQSAPITKEEAADVKMEDVKIEEASSAGPHQNGRSEADADSKAKQENAQSKSDDNSKADSKSEKEDEKHKGKGKDKDGKDNKSKQGNDGGQKKKEEKKTSPSKSSRRRNKRKNAAANNANSNNNHAMGDRPPAIKLHIGNLAYSTTQATLYEFFSAMCGRESVLECHIPTERDTGRSRGFGFVTLPEPIARNILKSGKKHEVDGRPLKIAESNSAGSGKSSRLPLPPPISAAERCANCGYRPKYCTCRAPNIPGFGPPPPPPPPPHMLPHGPPMDMMDYGRDYDYYGANRFRDDRFGHSNSPYDRPRPGERDRPYGRDPAQWGYHRDRSRSRSYGRDDDRVRDRSRRDRRGRDRSRSRSRSPRGRRGRDWDSDRRRGHRRSESRSRSRSRSYSSASSRSRSPPPAKRDHEASSSARKEKKNDAAGGKEPTEEARNAAAASASGNKPRENRKRSHSRGGGRKKKKSKRRSTRSPSRSRSRTPSPRNG